MNNASKNKFQSEQLRTVREHLTESEKQSLSRLTTRYGIRILFVAGISPGIAALHGLFGVVLAAVWVVIFFGSFLIMMSALSKFYCSTNWGKQHGYSHETFRFFKWPSGK